MDAEPAGLVRRRRHHPATARAADDHRKTPQFGPAPELDRHVERVHVHVQDRSGVRHHHGTLVQLRGTDAYDGPVPDPSESLSALPSTAARAMAFVSILLGGFAGGLIGYALVDVQCDGSCGVPLGLGMLIGSVLSAGGTAIVAVLVLRALGEWREISDRAAR